MSAHTCEANESKSDRLYEPFIPVEHRADLVRIGCRRRRPHRGENQQRGDRQRSRQRAGYDKEPFDGRPIGISSSSPMIACDAPPTRRHAKKSELSGTDSTLTALNFPTSIFSNDRRCRGLVQPDDQDPGGPDFGPAGGDRRRQPGDHARPSVDGTAHSERWHCRPTTGGRRRRTSDNPHRDATARRPVAQRQRRGLAAAAEPASRSPRSRPPRTSPPRWTTNTSRPST